MQVLLVEDDESLAAGLIQALKAEGFSVSHVALGAHAQTTVQVDGCDIVVLDLGLPDMDGMDVLRGLRRHHPDVPVLILTARGGLEDRVSGLNQGADDYLAKPFEIVELVARLRVLERRISLANSAEICVGPVCLDASCHQVRVNGTGIELSRRKFMLLKALMENAGRIQTRDRLESRLYSEGEEVASNALEVHVHHLRRKLPDQFIQTVRGVGYTVKTA